MEDEIEFLYLGWCKEFKNGVNSDKVWAAFKAGSTYYACWGARDKKLSFKNHGNNPNSTLNSVIRKKKKDYEEVDAFHLFTIFPHIKEDISKYLMFDLLTNKVK
ncbi:MAG TPA: hypothetical protein VFM18_17880 [Methanosarcina sp.]|nr:hypothetical protein [Methanosarcina sp.]